MKKIYAFLTGIAVLANLATRAQTTVDLKVFLEGPYFSGALTPWLNGWGYLPLDHPYDASPWFYYGPETVTAIPNADVVDWVLMELRQTTGPASTAIQDSAIARQVGFILETGSIVSVDGSSPLQFNFAVTSNLYAVVMTRNHLAIMSGYPLQLSGGVYNYDFTTSADKVYGGVNGHKQIATGIWAMVSGDGDSNGNVNNADKIDVWKPQSGNAGYLNGDFNMNGQVDNVDKNEFWKINSGRSSQVPGGSVNTPPVAVIQVNPPTGTTITVFTLDASASYDAQSKPALLAARWDFENDGTWDTPYSTTKAITHQYMTAGDYIIKVKVIDVGGLTDTATYNLQVGQSYGTPCPGIPTVNYEGQVYNTVQIGTQCWLKENLNVGTMINGSQNQANNQVIEKYCYNNDPGKCSIYGGLYQWDELMQYTNQAGARGICPPGWHVPKQEEWNALVEFLGGIGVAGGKMKDVGTLHWNPPNVGATNESGFTALPGGSRPGSSYFTDLGNTANFWSSTEAYTTYAWLLTLVTYDAGVLTSYNPKTNAVSARCIMEPPPPVWSCGDTIVDARDGQVYNTVEIGTLCWMQENLNIGTMIQGSASQTNNGIIEKYCYSNSQSNCNVYGGLYQWDEVMQYVLTPGVKGICPAGWHLPKDDEWCILEQTVDPTITCSSTGWRGIDGGGKLKEAGTFHWHSPNTGATNSSGFTALPAGFRDLNYGFYNQQWSAHFWSSNEFNSTSTLSRYLSYDIAQVNRRNDTKNLGLSVRCLKDTPPVWSCGDTIVDARDGQVYNTVEIGTQCWMQENLNIGTMIQSTSNQANNSIIEKYCYENNTSNCDIYGGLYQWDEMMQYATTPGVQGICLAGWHLPTDPEYCTLTQFVDPTVNCDITGESGTDVGTKMKSTTGWYEGGNGTNASGFTVLPSGNSPPGGMFSGLTTQAYFYSSSASGDYALCRNLTYYNTTIRRHYDYEYHGFSVRCIKDAPPPTWSCGDTIVDARDNQVYNTVEIGTQCWMQENLNIGTMIQGTSNQTNNGILEKYCYENSIANCNAYGGLYQWDEMMQFDVVPGVKGICSSGWHLPTDVDYCTLTQYIDSSVDCNATNWSGIDVGTKMKSTSGWNSGGNGTNTSGFSALPGGISAMNGYFMAITSEAHFWNSTLVGSFGWYRSLGSSFSGIYRYYSNKLFGFSVRCLKDAPPPVWSCGDTIVDARDGQVYNTVEIGSQCWMQKNLNIGTMIQGTLDQSNNSVIEKYCYDNSTANCDVYGGLYQWNEMMQYVTTPGAKGICPVGWHLPTDAEWCTLEQYVDPTITCSSTGWRGIDGGGKLKETGTIHWAPPNTGATNSSGFTALPGGNRFTDGNFNSLTYLAYFWSSSESGTTAWRRHLYYDLATVNRDTNNKYLGFSVRCEKD